MDGKKHIACGFGSNEACGKSRSFCFFCKKETLVTILDGAFISWRLR